MALLINSKLEIMTNNKVKVHSDKAGNVISVSKNNKDYGHIHVSQVRMLIDETTGKARSTNVNALIWGEVKDLKGFGWKAGDEVNGQIIIKESRTPFNPKDPEKDFKIAGKTGINCTLEGDPIYRKHFYTSNMNASDISLMHDNTEEIKAAYARIKDEEEVSASKTDSEVGQL